MIYACQIDDVNYLRTKLQCDEIYTIMRSCKRVPYMAKECKALAPSKELFYSYLNWRNSGNWNKKTFDELYTPKFLKELINENSINWLNYLYQKSFEKDIILVCSCKEYEMCHRSIVETILYNCGAKVNRHTDINYLEMFNKLRSEAV